MQETTAGNVTEFFASAASFADWDEDWDLDMLVGNIYGTVAWAQNLGGSAEPRFSGRNVLYAGGEAMHLVARRDAHPISVDWDHDGTPDLLVGFGDGSVIFYRGMQDEPGTPLELEAGRILIEPHTLGQRAKLFVCDWNNDGHLDLLVGTHGYVLGEMGIQGTVHVLLRRP